MPRFVILRHEPPAEGSRELHWDFMLEQNDGSLRTWALAEEPSLNRCIAATQLDDHRAAYLDYEGPISGDRGTVQRWDAGTFVAEESSDTELRVRLNGGRLQCTTTLVRKEDQSWEASFFVA